MSLTDVKVRILARVDLVQLIGEVVSLAPRGDHHSGVCPFHADKGPSFAVYPDHYYCYGCKTHGDAITFVREREALSFTESLKFLASKYGIEAPELDEDRGRFGSRQKEQSLYKMLADAQAFYETNLHHELGQEAREYLSKRGFTEASIKDFGFGLTPREGFGLVRMLRSKGYREEDMISVALATASARDGRPFDFFRSRITLPIRDPQGRVIGFGGRTTDNNPAKYMNSRETPLFDKSRTLFGFDRARKIMREKGRALVVEGYMDATMLWQHGFGEVVACLGTAFTESHLRQLKNATTSVVLVLDGDSAGQNATLAAVEVAMAVSEIPVFAIELPDGDDPDSFVVKHGGDALEALLQKKVRILDYVLSRRLAPNADTANTQILKDEIFPWLSRVPSQLDRSYLIERISHRTGLSKADILIELGAASTPIKRVGAEADRVGAVPNLSPVEREFVGHVFFSVPGELSPDEVMAAARREFEFAPAHLTLLELLVKNLAAGVAPASITSESLALELTDMACAILDDLRKNIGAFSSGAKKESRRERFDAFLLQKRALARKDALSLLKRQLATVARSPGQEGEVSRLLREIEALSRPPPSSPS